MIKSPVKKDFFQPFSRTVIPLFCINHHGQIQQYGSSVQQRCFFQKLPYLACGLFCLIRRASRSFLIRGQHKKPRHHQKKGHCYSSGTVSHKEIRRTAKRFQRACVNGNNQQGGNQPEIIYGGIIFSLSHTPSWPEITVITNPSTLFPDTFRFFLRFPKTELS